MKDYIHNACEEIDAAMFSGDTFIDPEERKNLREYMARWEKELKNWDDSKIEEAING